MRRLPLPSDIIKSNNSGQTQRELYARTFSNRPDTRIYRFASSAIKLLGNWFLYSWAAGRVARLGENKSLSILDAGCGDGIFRRFVAPQHRYTGLDFSLRPLLRARKTPTDTYVLGDLTHLPFPDAAFDVVVSLQALQYLLCPSNAVRECQRVLRPGGTLLLSVPNRDCVKYRKQGTPPVQLAEFDHEGVGALLSLSSLTPLRIERLGLWLPVPKLSVHLPGRYPGQFALAWTAEAQKHYQAETCHEDVLDVVNTM